MRRLTVAFVTLISAAILAACGDAGDHFGEFRQQPPPPSTAVKILAQMPVVPGPFVPNAKLPLYVTVYDGSGNAIAPGTNLKNPIIIQTNYAGNVRFTSPTGPTSKTYKSLSLQAAPPTITVFYTRPPFNPCRNAEPPVVVTAFNHDASPQFSTVNLSDCNGAPTPSPSPSPKPSSSPTPTPTPSPTPSPTPT